MKTLLHNGTLVSRDGILRGDIAISGGIIQSVGSLVSFDNQGYEIIDATGKLIFPGGFDPHVHMALPTPAGPSCDDFRSGSQAALAGGTTFFMDFVTPVRGQSLHEALALRRKEASASLCGCGLHMGISEWNPRIAEEIVPLVRNEGIRSFKAYMAYNETIGIGYDDLEGLMRIAGEAGAVVMVHCEDGRIIAERTRQLLAEGNSRPCFHAVSRPSEAEVMAIEKVIALAAKTGCRTYIVHISTGAGAALVAEAKAAGIPVHAETCPHYLLFDDSVYDPLREDPEVLPFILSPPIRSQADREILWQRVADGTFDTIGTDHCPFRIRGQKDRGLSDFTLIPNGAGGIRHRLEVLYTYGVLPGRISPERFADLVSARPAEIFGYGDRKGKLLPGYDADIVIWDPGAVSETGSAAEGGPCDSDIYRGQRLAGKAETILGGELWSGI